MNLMVRTLRTAEALARAELVPDARNEAIARVAKKYAVAVTPAMAALMDTSDPNDPIARQFVPDVRELETHPRELSDPIGDRLHSPVPGIVNRYGDRVLLKIVSVCPVYCRFCFRREMVGPEKGEALTSRELDGALRYIVEHAKVGEVILTGGDPFVLSPKRIRVMTSALGAIAHVKTLRWHTRVPVVDPARVTGDMVAALTASNKTIVVALHTNHPRELTDAARTAIAMLSNAGVMLLSQTVLLRGVNDDAGTLAALMRALIECRIKPYYLHHGDLAPGTAHFRKTIDDGKAIVAELRRRLSGIAMPSYVLDIPGGYGKVPIESHVTSLGNGRYSVRDLEGNVHAYEDT